MLALWERRQSVPVDHLSSVVLAREEVGRLEVSGEGLVLVVRRLDLRQQRRVRRVLPRESDDARSAALWRGGSVAWVRVGYGGYGQFRLLLKELQDAALVERRLRVQVDQIEHRQVVHIWDVVEVDALRLVSCQK